MERSVLVDQDRGSLRMAFESIQPCNLCETSPNGPHFYSIEKQYKVGFVWRNEDCS
jgi:hypothetical protein